MKAQWQVTESQVVGFSQELNEAISRILDKDVSGFKQLKIHASGDVTLLTGQTQSGVQYSEFHFGAGESSIIRMVAAIEAAKDQTLVLIEEIENGLHPVATIRLVEYLIWAAERKKIQVIFTTHSNEALQPLPSKAIWAATKDKLFQGKLDIASLRAITGQIETSSVIFVEDDFAKTWVESILRQGSAYPIEHFQVHAMAGDGAAVSMNTYHNSNPSISVPSTCVIDGDSRQEDDPAKGIFRLPGNAPEAFVFDSCIEAWPEIGGKLSVALLQEFTENDRVLEACRHIRISNKDTHLLFSQLGAKLGLIPAQTVSLAFTTIWAQLNKQAVGDLAGKIIAFSKREKQPTHASGNNGSREIQ
ncbi:AAA family ATPase [Bradyrhizobium sp. USDA 3364]